MKGDFDRIILETFELKKWFDFTEITTRDCKYLTDKLDYWRLKSIYRRKKNKNDNGNQIIKGKLRLHLVILLFQILKMCRFCARFQLQKWIMMRTATSEQEVNV